MNGKNIRAITRHDRSRHACARQRNVMFRNAAAAYVDTRSYKLRLNFTARTTARRKIRHVNPAVSLACRSNGNNFRTYTGRRNRIVRRT